MARQKSKTSKLSFMNLGLTPSEDKAILQKLKEDDVKARHLLRKWFRAWLNGEL